ncbi:MAG: hypothetical protein B6D34_04180 [Candidatus Brocadia sp. UTAMX1]|nr:MAG: hypothetical protein B6D34_04180 [Candidatus Brocadia sp. UTAMX1]
MPIRSRDEPPLILRALQHIYVTPELNAEVFRILEEKVQNGKKRTGRYGMELWHILVLSVARLGLDADYAGWMISPIIISLSGRFLG